MLYAYARIQGIRRKALDAIGGASDGSAAASANAGVVVDLSSSLTTAPFTPEEKMLAKQLLRLDEVLEEVARDLYPNKVPNTFFRFRTYLLSTPSQNAPSQYTLSVHTLSKRPRYTYILYQIYTSTSIVNFPPFPAPSYSFLHPPMMHQLCEYLFELSQRFNQFYEKCPVLKAETLELQQSRTALCSLTAGDK